MGQFQRKKSRHHWLRSLILRWKIVWGTDDGRWRSSGFAGRPVGDPRKGLSYRPRFSSGDAARTSAVSPAKHPKPAYPLAKQKGTRYPISAIAPSDRPVSFPMKNAKRSRSRTRRRQRDFSPEPLHLVSPESNREMDQTSPDPNTISQDVTPLSSAPTGLPSPRRSGNRARWSPTGLRSSRQPRTPFGIFTLYAIRLLIVGVGLGVIAGSLLTALDPASHTSVAASEAKPDATDPSSQSVSTHPTTTAKPLTAQRTALQVTTEMQPLKQDVQALIAQQTDLVPGIFILDLDTGSYLDINGKQVFPTASMIKVPILVAFFQDVDAGKIRLDEQLTMRADLIASESGNMQYLPVGSKFTALETASEMIRISDNTATNMIIDRLGGVNVLNQRFQSWGLTDTKISNVLPDLEGTNISSPRDFVKLLALVSQGDLISLRSRDRCLSILRTPVTDTLLPKGLGEGATIAHKTGDIGSLVGDVGLIDMPSGKRYLAAVMVKRPYNDSRAQELIRQISRATYQYLQSSVHQSERNSPGVLPVNNVAIDATPPQPTSMSLQD